MAATSSKLIQSRLDIQNFELKDAISHKIVSLNELKSPFATVIFFISNNCGFTQHILRELIKTANEYQPKGINFIAINSNDSENYPEESAFKMTKLATDNRFPFLYLDDYRQEVAGMFLATCTPEFFILDKDFKLVYHGQFDDSRPTNSINPSGNDIRSALNSLLSGKKVDELQKPALGNPIKWKY